MTTKELLPGDIISLSFKKRTSNKKKAAAKAIATAPAAGGTTSDTTVATGMHFYTASSILIFLQYSSLQCCFMFICIGTSTTTPATAPEDSTTPSALTSRDEIVPCDCVLIRGKAVVNEASLTGMYILLSILL